MPPPPTPFDPPIPDPQIIVRGMGGDDHVIVDGTNFFPFPDLSDASYQPNKTAPIGLDDRPSYGGRLLHISFSDDDPPVRLTFDVIL